MWSVCVYVCMGVCVYVCDHDISKTITAGMPKLGIYTAFYYGKRHTTGGEN